MQLRPRHASDVQVCPSSAARLALLAAYATAAGCALSDDPSSVSTTAQSPAEAAGAATVRGETPAAGSAGMPAAASTGASAQPGAHAAAMDSATDMSGAPAQGQRDAPAPAGQGADAHPLMGLRAYPHVQYPPENPDSDAKALLGKVLFWEEQLSGDDSTACGSCHQGSAGGSDPRSQQDVARRAGPDGVLDAVPTRLSDDGRGSLGVVACAADGTHTGQAPQVTGRKAPSAYDAMWTGDIFWDGRATRDFVDPDSSDTLIAGSLDPQSGRIVGGALESQAIGPPMSDVEMACANPSWPRVYDKLAKVKPLALASAIPADMQAFIEGGGGSYPRLFAEAFGNTLRSAPSDPDDVINAPRIAFAIATYERRLTSDQTPWDRWNAGDASALTPQQVRGFELFMGKANCQACHAPPLFLDLTFHYLGFHPIARDPGQGALADNPDDRAGMMKTPSLRNVGLRETGGLTHQGDGPGHDLPTVLALYRDGGLRDDPAIVDKIDPLLVPLDLSDDDLVALADFLRNGLTDPRVQREAPPFDRPKLGSEAQAAQAP